MEPVIVRRNYSRPTSGASIRRSISSNPAQQIAYYDDGVGTSSFKLFAILGGVFGFGLKRNVIDIYSFCCRNYQRWRQDLRLRVQPGRVHDPSGRRLHRAHRTCPLQWQRCAIWRAMPKSPTANIAKPGISSRAPNILIGPLRALRIGCATRFSASLRSGNSIWTEVEKIDFLGVWDTVDAYGGPIDEITRAIDYWYWPLSMPDQFMNRKIGRACHALALEEERDSFHPVLWDDRYVRNDDKLYAVDYSWKPAPANSDRPLAQIDRERISQVWFVGVHSDIGGGYSRAGLSYHSLAWMMERAECLWFAVPDDTGKLAQELHRSLRQAQQFTAWSCRLLSLSAAQARRHLQPASIQVVAPQRFSTHRQLVEEPAGP